MDSCLSGTQVRESLFENKEMRENGETILNGVFRKSLSEFVIHKLKPK